MTPESAQSVSWWMAPRINEIVWLDHYLLSAEEAWREPLVAAMHRAQPFGSVCEVGCHCGPNLKRFRQAYGAFPYTGLDVNGRALAYGRRMALRDGYGDEARWFLGSVLDPVAMSWPDREFETVVSSSMLSLLSPEDVGLALIAMARIANTRVMIQEPTDASHDGYFHQWVHDYPAMLAQVVPAFTVAEMAAGVLVAERHS